MLTYSVALDQFRKPIGRCIPFHTCSLLVFKSLDSLPPIRPLTCGPNQYHNSSWLLMLLYQNKGIYIVLVWVVSPPCLLVTCKFRRWQCLTYCSDSQEITLLVHNRGHVWLSSKCKCNIYMRLVNRLTLKNILVSQGGLCFILLYKFYHHII